MTPLCSRIGLMLGAVLYLASLQSQAQSGKLADLTTPSPNLAGTQQQTVQKLSFSPLRLSGGTVLTVIAPSDWLPVVKRVSSILESSHGKFSSVLGKLPALSTPIKLVDSEQFYRQTGAPRWTNAMYYRGEIIIPLSLREPINHDNLERSIKHEFTHAIVNSLSAGKCPGWLDEGLAQWAEGSENPALRPALQEWLDGNPPVSLSLLQGGFTRLQTAMVPAAYAQSLYAASTVIENFGFENIRVYLNFLKAGENKAAAFKKSFRVSEDGFEKALGMSLKRWRKHHH